jgi:hypothetical protein
MEAVMRYSTGEEVDLNDVVEMGGGMTGVVVCDIDKSRFVEAFPLSTWGELKTGVIVRSEQAGVVHYPKEDPHLFLIRKVEK